MKKTSDEVKWLGEILGVRRDHDNCFLAGFFHVTHDGLSKRGTTLSLVLFSLSVLPYPWPESLVLCMLTVDCCKWDVLKCYSKLDGWFFAWLMYPWDKDFSVSDRHLLKFPCWRTWNILYLKIPVFNSVNSYITFFYFLAVLCLVVYVKSAYVSCETELN